MAELGPVIPINPREIDEDLLQEILKDYTEIQKRKPISVSESFDSFLELFNYKKMNELALSTAYDQAKKTDQESADKIAERVDELKKDFPNTFGYLDKSKIIDPAGKLRYDAQDDYLDVTKEAEKVLLQAGQKTIYNIVDIATLGIDYAFDKNFGGKLEKLYNTYKFNRNPETFIGAVSELLLQYAVPWRVASKVIKNLGKTRLGKGISKGLDKIDEATANRFGIGNVGSGIKIKNPITGKTKFIGTKGITKVARRTGNFAATLALAEKLGGSPDAIGTMFLPLEDTSKLSGRERAAADFKNRLMYGAEGTIFGLGLPLVGKAVKPVVGGTFKVGTFALDKVARSGGKIASVGSKIVPDIVKDAASVSGKKVAQGVQKTASFLGKDVLARAALLSFKNPTMLLKKIPDFKDWKASLMMDRNNPLYQRLNSLDNFLALFRTRGRLSKEAAQETYNLNRKLKMLQGGINRSIESIDRVIYDLVKPLRALYDKNPGSPASYEYFSELIEQFMRGEIKKGDLPKELQIPATLLKTRVEKIFKNYDRLFNKGEFMNDIGALMKNYYQKTFKLFSNEDYILKSGDKVYDAAVKFMENVIRNNKKLELEATRKVFPKLTEDEAITQYAKTYVDGFLDAGKSGKFTPLEVIRNMVGPTGARISDDPTELIKTGYEKDIPDVFKKLLGEEKSYKKAALQSTIDLMNKSTTRTTYDEHYRIGKNQNWIFDNKEIAKASGLKETDIGVIKNSKIAEVMGEMNTKYAEKTIAAVLSGTNTGFDFIMKIPFYAEILQLKAGAQLAKTVLSPATQVRNVTSAGLFAVANGHFGTYSDLFGALKMNLDDIFGPGAKTDLEELFIRTERKVEVGAIDDNLIIEEITKLLGDIRANKISTIDGLVEKLSSTKLMKTLTKIYAGGDNLWKWQGHEYTMSQLKTFIKTPQDVKNWYAQVARQDWNPKNILTGVDKTIDEAIEEMAGWYIQNTYPSYSKIPRSVQAIRMLPLGNFVAFPAEMIRTTFNIFNLGLREVASGTRELQVMGLKRLAGGSFVLGGLNEIAEQVTNTYSGFDERLMRMYKKYFAKPWEVNSKLAVITAPKDGKFTSLNLSHFNPYAGITDSFSAAARLFTEKRQGKFNPLDFGNFVLYNFFRKDGPMETLFGSFLAEPIAYEALIDIIVRNGRTAEGKVIFSETDSDEDKFMKMLTHTLNTINAGGIDQAGNVLNAATGEVRSDGTLYNLYEELVSILGGVRLSKADILTTFDFELAKYGRLRSDVFQSEGFYRVTDYQSRGPEIMANEFRNIQEEYYKEQEELYHMVMSALELGVPKDKLIEKLEQRLGFSADDVEFYLLEGKFKPVKYSLKGLESRYNKFQEQNKDLLKEKELIAREGWFVPADELDSVIDEYDEKKFRPLDEVIGEGPSMKEIQEERTKEVVPEPQAKIEPEIQTPPLPNQPDPSVAATTKVANVSNPLSSLNGLSQAEQALLSPGEQAIAQRLNRRV
jgi:hypothetical protein